MATDFEETTEFLLGMTDGESIDNNIWIAFSAATVHMTCDTTGFVNNKMAPKTHTITLGNGQEETVTRIMDIKGKVLNHENKAWENVILQ
jgi:hypothetical protein